MKKRLTNMKMKKFTGFLMAILAVTVLYSCSNDDSNGGDDSARVKVRMTDAPGDYKSVFVNVTDVMIKSDASASEEEAWVSLTGVQTGMYDLLTLTGGVTQLLADAEVEAGYLSEIRLVLGDDNYLILNDESRQELSTPSAQQSGLKIKVDQELEAGQEYEFLLDFDVDKSIVSAGNSGGFILKPVIRATATAETGTIIGEVHPTNFQSEITAQSATTTISAYTNANGEFALNGVPAGIYKVTIKPSLLSGFQVKTINNIEVTTNGTIDLEPIFLD
ncbi:DUF4382 domain-containing protein [Gillisia hiemivivida]|uniref:DUF4382 domain-containing protein n=2 Tax=Gillisia hiemivivida TaxID=291190 RepID=A0A5C6ZZI0_9FLAO|nr:DUF4382 domain-containing protein [Gillisia hiemivivida]